jgi:hypothetical protein
VRVKEVDGADEVTITPVPRPRRAAA